MKDSRLVEISYMRVLAMLMVVLFHSYYVYVGTWPFNAPEIGMYNLFCKTLHRIDMNIFVFISGYLYFKQRYEKRKYQECLLFIINKTKRLIFPYLIWGVFQVLLLNLSFNSLLTGAFHLWFLLMMFWIFIFIRIIEYLLKLDSTKVFLDIILIIGFTWVWLLLKFLNINPTFLSIVRAADYFPFFLFGFVFAKYKIVDRLLISNRMTILGGGTFVYRFFNYRHCISGSFKYGITNFTIHHSSSSINLI